MQKSKVFTAKVGITCLGESNGGIKCLAHPNLKIVNMVLRKIDSAS